MCVFPSFSTESKNSPIFFCFCFFFLPALPFVSVAVSFLSSLIGLGTSDRTEAKEYFSNLDRNLIPFTTLSADPVGEVEVSNMIDMCFNKKKAEQRKIWINGYEDGTHVDFNVDEMAYSDFVDKEYIIMAVQSNLRGIPHVIDGFKPSQRKILFSCLKRKLHSEIKVAQLAGYVNSSRHWPIVVVPSLLFYRWYIVVVPSLCHRCCSIVVVVPSSLVHPCSMLSSPVSSSPVHC